MNKKECQFLSAKFDLKLFVYFIFNIIHNLFQLNPHHEVSAIVDEDLNLFDSRDILIYLFNKYAQDKHDYLYP